MKKFSAILFLLLAGSLFLEAQNLISQQDEKGKYGFVNEAGEFVIQPKYEDVGIEFTDGVACVKQKGKFVFIDANGKEVSKKTYTWVNYFDENGLCMVNNGGKVNDNDEVRGGKFGYIDRTGKEVIPLKYSLILPFNSNGVACVNTGGSYTKEGDFTGGKYGFVNILGKELISPKYTRIGNFNDAGIAWINIGGKDNAKTGEFTGGKFGYVNDRGVEVVAPKYSFVGPFIDGFCWVNNGGKVFLRDKKLEKKLQAHEKMLKDVEKKSAKYAKKNEAKMSSFAKEYKQILDTYIAGGKEDAELATKYEGMDNFIFEQEDWSEKMRKYREKLVFESTGGKKDVRQVEVAGGKFGFVDVNGREITKVKYTQTANFFTEDRAWVKMGKKYGYVDNSGREITKIKYDEVAPAYHNNFANVILKQRYGLVNSAGQEVTEIKYLSVGNFDSGFTWVKKFPEKKGKTLQSAKYGFIDERGHFLTDFKYDMVHPEISEGIIGTYYDGSWCYVDNQGKEILKDDFLELSPFDGGVAWAKKSIPQTDGTINSPIDTKSLNESLIQTLAGLEVSLLKTKFESIKELHMESIKSMKHSIMSLTGPGVYALIDKDGNQITDYEFIKVGKFSDDLACVTKVVPEALGARAGYINRKGETVVPFNYIAGLSFKEGMAAVKNPQEKWGFVNKEGIESVACQYNSVTKSFKEGLAGVKVDELWGGVNTKGDMVIPPYLSLPKDVASIAAKYSLYDGEASLTIRQVTLYNTYQKNTRKRYSITTVIPDDMWDF